MKISLYKKNANFFYLNRQKLIQIIQAILVFRKLDLIKKTINIILINHKKITQLNQKFLQHRGRTDVITFDYQNENCEVLGEIFICLDTTLKQAQKFKNDFNEELVLYITHGILHLLGFKDKTKSQRKEMRREEKKTLAFVRKKLPNLKTLVYA